MASRDLNLYIDQDGQKLVSSFSGEFAAQPLIFTKGDNVPITARVLDPNPTGIRDWDDADLTNKIIRVGIGVPGSRPTSGTFTVTYDGDTTTALDFDATAEEFQTELNLLASIVSAGGVTVTKPTNSVYRVIFNDVGSRTAFSTDNENLYPRSDSNADIAIAGGASIREVVLISFETQPIAYAELTTSLPAAGANVSIIREYAPGTNQIQRLSLNPIPYAGKYSIITDLGAKTNLINYNAPASEIEAALDAALIYPNSVSVTGSFPTYDIEFVNSTDPDVYSINADLLDVPTGLSGSLNCNTAGFVELLSGAAEADATLEVEIYDTVSSTSYTAIQTSCLISEDINSNSPTSQTPLPTYLTTLTAGITIAEILGLSSYADLTAANAALTPGIPYWDVALGRINVSTA